MFGGCSWCKQKIAREKLRSSRSRGSNFHVALFVVVVVAVVELVGCLRPEEYDVVDSRLETTQDIWNLSEVALMPRHLCVLTWCSFPRRLSRRGRARRCARSSACRRERRGSGRWARGSTSSSSRTPSDGSAPSTAPTMDFMWFIIFTFSTSNCNTTGTRFSLAQR